MNINIIKFQTLQFCIMFLVGMFLNPMNILAFRLSDVYLSLTLVYVALFMASNMTWAHQIIHYIYYGHFNKYVFFIGIIMSLFVSIFLLRNQLFVRKEQWLKRMISHHSTALTTTNKLLQNQNNFINNPELYRLAKDIVYNQEKEIDLMKNML